MIPRIQSIDDIDISGARWVFIIEKEVWISSLQPTVAWRVLADLLCNRRQSSTG
jgi:hypothetical protein